ncbi:GNAT family N-acetyltransferase [Alicyclobacillus fructus]|uniref:GNAT family N-acetyltransferase n=1 Tax=Alicyclobacillus fructus TaxID=2816082 RepID=UPI002E2C25E8|nr:GNAT family N-acetyltransferase [Alicyclobacillus fructus]
MERVDGAVFRLSMNDWDALDALYRQCAGCPDWPRDVRDRQAWLKLMESWQIGAWLGDAAVAIAMALEDCPVGYAAITLAFDNDPALGRAMEVGTFIAPSARGTGLNAQLKHWAKDEASRLGANWLVACIPVHHARAARAFLKVYPDATVYEGEPNHPWWAYWKRRSFAAGEAVRLFALPIA